MGKNILDAFAPLNVLSKICGFSLFTIDRVDYSISFKRFDVICQVWIVSLIFFSSFCMFDLEKTLPIHKSHLVSKCLPIILCTSYVLYILTMVATLHSRSKQSILIRYICEIDEMLRELGCKFDYQQQRRVVINKVAVMLLAIGTQVAQNFALQFLYKISPNYITNGLLFFWSFLTFTVLLLNYTFMADAVKQRFAKINECLKQKALTTVDIQKLATIHEQLTEVIILINQVYSILVMFYFGGIFCVSNLFIFNLVTVQNYYDDLGEFLLMASINAAWTFYDIMLLFFVVQATTAASSEGKKSTNLIYKIVNTSMDGKLNRRLMSFSHQIESCRLDFSCGLFTYDWSLCFKLISASVMYLVILIQFESALPKKNAAN